MAKRIAKLLLAVALLLTLGTVVVSQNSAQAAPAAICTDPAGENIKAAYSRESGEVVVIHDDESTVCGTFDVESQVAFDFEGNLWILSNGTLFKNGSEVASSLGNLTYGESLYAGDVVAVGSTSLTVFSLSGDLLVNIPMNDINGININGSDAVFAQQDLLGNVTSVVAVDLAAGGNSLLIYEDEVLDTELDVNVLQIEPFGLNLVADYDFLFLRGFDGSQGMFWKLNLGNYMLSEKAVPNYGAVWSGIGNVNVGSFHYHQEISSLLRTFSPISMSTSSGATVWPYGNMHPFSPRTAATVAGHREAFLGFRNGADLNGLVHMTLANEYPQYSVFDSAQIVDVATTPLFTAPSLDKQLYLPFIVK